MDYSNINSLKFYQNVINDLSKFPFSFKYGDKSYSGFDPQYFILKNKGSVKNDKNEMITFQFELENTLSVKLKTSFYPEYGVYEWTVFFKNISESDSKIISEPKATLKFSGNLPILKGIHGDLGGSYMPYSYDLSIAPAHFNSVFGRPTHVHFPYFNLEYGNKGVILAIGWGGTWSSDFIYDSSSNVTTYSATSVNGLNTYLKPNEEIRTALFVIANYNIRNENYATNFWRSFYINCNMPKADIHNSNLKPFSTINFANDTGRPNSDGSISETYFTWKPSFEKLLDEKIEVDFRWVDAGWYESPDGTTVPEDWFGTIGTWTLDKNKWPGQTFLHSTDFAREHGMKTLLWFEPERITSPDKLFLNYGYNPDWAIGYKENRHIMLNNIGNPNCFNWTKNRIIDILNKNKVELYREDFNCNPAELWELQDKNEGENRNGITESKMVWAHYKLWDDIIEESKKSGGCAFVDSCASGGGRCDIESMRRAVPILRSDSDRTSTSLRLAITSSYNKWIPFCGANTREKKGQLDATGRMDVYTYRASYNCILNVETQLVQTPNEDFETIRKCIAEWKQISPYFLKDFYVLSQYHLPYDKTGYTVYCYHDPETDSAILFVFRMEDSKMDTIKISLPFIDGSQMYKIKDFDDNKIVGMAGKILNDGFSLKIANPRTAKLFKIYK